MQLQTASLNLTTIRHDPAVIAEQFLKRLSTLEDSLAAGAVPTFFGKGLRGDFELDGLHFTYTRQKNATGYMVYFKAQVGFLPYTASGNDKRAALTAILYGARKLSYAHFRLDQQSCVFIEREFTFPHEPDDLDMLIALTMFYQQAKPFLSLIAEHL